MKRRCRHDRPRLYGLVLALGLLVGDSTAAEPEAPIGIDREALAAVNQTLKQFDRIRALMMRSLIRVQDLKCVYLYGRGWGLDMPEAVPEDMLIEGLWLFDYLDAMDLTSNSLISYAIAGEHPNLNDELGAFRTFLPEASRTTLTYHAKVWAALTDALEKVKAAAARKQAYAIETTPARRWVDGPMQRLAGDGFNLGFSTQVLPSGHYRNFLDRHNYSNERIFELMAEAGVDFFQPIDTNVFDWADVEKQEGTFDWTRADQILELHRKYNLPIFLEIGTTWLMPPDWLVEKLGNRALLVDAGGTPIETALTFNTYAAKNGWGLMGLRDRRAKQRFVDLFDPETRSACGRYIRELLAHVQERGVPIYGIQIGGESEPPKYAGPRADARLRVWLRKRYGDVGERWGADVDVSQVSLDPQWLKKVEEAGDTDAPGKKRMKIDIARWRDDEHFEYLRAVAEAVRAAAPDVPICTLAVEPFEFNESMNGRQAERALRELKLVPYGATNRNYLDDWRRCVSPVGSAIAIASTGCGNAYTQYQFSGYVHDALSVVTGPYPIVRAFYHGEVVIYPDMRWEWSALLGYRRFHERAQGIGPEMLNTHQTPQVAILRSDTSSKYQHFITTSSGHTAPDPHPPIITGSAA